VAVIALFFGSIQAMKLIPNIFFPPSDRPFFKLDIELPTQTAIEQTELVVADIERYMNTLKADGEQAKGITDWVTYIGSGGVRFLLTHSPKPASPAYSLMVVNTTGADVNKDIMDKIESYINQHHPDAKPTLRLIENGKAILNPVEIRVFGKDVDKLFVIIDDIKQQLANVDGLKAITDDWGQRIKKLRVEINQEKAKRAGVTSQDIAISLQTSLSGYEMTEYREGETSIPVILRTRVADRQDIGKIETLSVFSQATGESVPLLQVANISMEWEPAKILRRDRLKAVSVGAQLEGDFTASEGFDAIDGWLKTYSQDWPIGFYYEYGGERESSGESSQSIAEKLPIAVFIIVMLLVAQFNSLRKPFIILTTIPLGVIGVIWGLIIADSFFGFMTLLGIISLAGIVINNAIVLLERIKIEMDVNGLEPQQAIIEAAQRRMRPILLTTATTVMGLVPLYLGGGEMWEPMAVGIMAGLLFSTLLTLGFIPVLFSLLYRISYKGFKQK
jgi:multidrug efflux pump